MRSSAIHLNYTNNLSLRPQTAVSSGFLRWHSSAAFRHPEFMSTGPLKVDYSRPSLRTSGGSSAPPLHSPPRAARPCMRGSDSSRGDRNVEATHVLVLAVADRHPHFFRLGALSESSNRPNRDLLLQQPANPPSLHVSASLHAAAAASLRLPHPVQARDQRRLDR